jgi:uncharacterized membrane protein YcaP (DUF421 family)
MMDVIDQLFGLDADQLTLLQMMARSFMVLLTALVLIRVAGIRMLGNHSAFDNLTTLILGAILGRAIVVPDQPFFESLATVTILMILYRLFVWITLHNATAGKIIKGQPIPLRQNNEWITDNLRRTGISIHDVEESLRQEMQEPNIDAVKEVYLERSGRISFVKKDGSTG